MKNYEYSSTKQIARALRSRNRCKRLAAVVACKGREDVPQELLELAASHASYFVAGHAIDIAATRDETMYSVIMAGLRHFDGEVVESAVWAAIVHRIPAETIHSWLVSAVQQPITA